MDLAKVWNSTEHFLDFYNGRNLRGLSTTASIASDDPELVFCTLWHVGESVLAHLDRCGVAQGPFHLVNLLHLNKVTSDDRTSLFLRWEPSKGY